MAKVQIEFEVENATAKEIGNGIDYFGQAVNWKNDFIEGMICIDEAHFQRDGEDDSFYVFKFIKAYD